MSDKIPLDLTWGNQNFDRSADTISAFTIEPGARKKSAPSSLTMVAKSLSYPACSAGSKLNGTFRHGKFTADEGQYIVIMNRGTYSGSSVRQGCIIVRARAKGELLTVEAKVSESKRSVHNDYVPVLTIRGDIVNREEASQMELLNGISRKENFDMFGDSEIGRAFSVKKVGMSDSTEKPVLRKVRTKHGEKVMAVAPKKSRHVRVRKR